MQELVQLKTRDGASRDGELEIVEFSSRQRFFRTFWRATIGLLISALLVLVPILHFILVPLGVLLTTLVALSSFRVSKEIAQGRGFCPYCHGPFNIFRRAYRLPFTDICEHCHRQVVVARIP